MDADVQEGLQNRQNDVNWRRLRWQFPKLPLHNAAFRNRGDLTFEEVGEKWHFGTDADISHTMAAADLDGDNDLDVVINRVGAPALLLRNDASAPRVAVRLKGDTRTRNGWLQRCDDQRGACRSGLARLWPGGLYMSHGIAKPRRPEHVHLGHALEVDWR